MPTSMAELKAMMARGGSRILDAPVPEDRAVRTRHSAPPQRKASISPVDIEEADRLREHLKPLAKQYGWQVRETWTPSGPDRGWHLTLLKPGRLIFATWRPQDYIPDRQEQQWQESLATLEEVRSYRWTLKQLPHIAQILAT